MSEIKLSAGTLELLNCSCSDTFFLSVRYNTTVSNSIDIRGIDNLYALQYLVNRAIQKLEQSS